MDHTGGMPRWRPVYALDPVPEKALQRLPSLQEVRPGARAEYSCPGYILLGRWLELETGLSLPDLAERHLFRPLGLMTQAFFPLPQGFPCEGVAATELGNRIERELSGGRAPRRASPIWGEVHDGNAFFLGGAAGNAGLFATAAVVAALARAAWVEVDRIPEPGTYRMGFKVGGNGTCFPEGTLGHNGFTGTSFCLHLRKKSRISLLLTNRLHRREPRDIFPLRKRFHAWAEDQG
jgi:CubicO group peptidase (beta-lactamase class C family)